TTSSTSRPASEADTCSRPAPTTTSVRAGSTWRAASRTASRRVRPETRCRTLASVDRIRDPTPAASTTARTGSSVRPARAFLRFFVTLSLGSELCGLRGEQLLETRRLPKRIEIPVVAGQNPIALVLLDRLLEVIEGRIRLSVLRVAAREEEVDAPVP